METSIQEVHLERAVRLEHYAGFDHLEPVVDELHRLGREVAALLGTSRVWMLNSSAAGGGVAEMMPRLCGLLGDVGVDTRWLVLHSGEPDFFHVTKSLHNLLHGTPAPLPATAADVFRRVSGEAARLLRFIGPEDVLVVHDPQPAGIAALLPGERRPRLVWRCHIGAPVTNEHTADGWSFLRESLRSFERLVFSAQPYVPGEYLDRSEIVAPGIDPLSHKNRELRPYKLLGVLRSAGLVEAPPVPSWASFAAPALRLVDGTPTPSPVPDLLFRPYVLQVSRFDRLKGFQHLLPAFERLLALWPARLAHLRVGEDRVRGEMSALQLLLAGPDPTGIADDPEAEEVFSELCAGLEALPQHVRERIHLLSLPMADRKQNALMVNALQRAATLVVQASTREGFGLTAAEALWKSVPVVASNVGGLAVQIRHEVDGYLVDDPSDREELAEGLFHMLSRPRDAERMGRSGRRRVQEHFLVLVQLRRWLEVLKSLLATPRK